MREARPPRTLVQRGPRRPTEQRRIHTCDCVGAFVSTPGKQQEYLRIAARAKREPCRVAAEPRIGNEVAAPERDLSFVGGKREPERPPDGMFERLAQKEHVGRTEAIVLKAGERGGAVEL